MKKFISLFLVFSVLLLSGNMFAKERKGADLILQKTDGQQVRGELIAVKENSLLLLDRDTGADVTVDIGDISSIEIVKKSKTLAWGSIGLLSGGVMGALVGYMEGDDPPGYGMWWGHRISWDIGILTAGEKALNYGILIGLSGAILGGIIGAIAGTDKTIQIEGKSDSEIQEILEKLRKQARVRNSR